MNFEDKLGAYGNLTSEQKQVLGNLLDHFNSLSTEVDVHRKVFGIDWFRSDLLKLVV